MDRDKISVHKTEETKHCNGCGNRRLKGVYSICLPYATSIIHVCDECREKLVNALKSE
ncbi:MULTISPECIES: hypothetical protein [Bacillus]|uniref:hypothetical protein n=1 Tax=Bacillus TaxID=1386 RepID=UPI0014246417|nr:hypothetical protein [Bacillus rugosus]NUF07840.1 hypothetical protein [Bacillus rugosus]